jgi:hypothetical protein
VSLDEIPILQGQLLPKRSMREKDSEKNNECVFFNCLACLAKVLSIADEIAFFL